MRSTRTWCGSAVWSRASMYPSRHASTSGVSIRRTYAAWTPVQATPGDQRRSAAPVVGAGDVGGPRTPVAPVAGDGDCGPGVPDRVVGGQRRPVASVDLPVAEVVGGAVGVLPAAGFRHGDLGGDEGLGARAARRLPEGLEAGAAERAAQMPRRGGQHGGWGLGVPRRVRGRAARRAVRDRQLLADVDAVGVADLGPVGGVDPLPAARVVVELRRYRGQRV